MELKNIIFDFGGVICNIDIGLTEKRFKEMGIRHFDPGYAVSESEDFFGRFETGKITPGEFRETLKRFFDRPVTHAEIDQAWNLLLLDIPEPRIRLLERLRKQYRIFLLSNSNRIHYDKYRQDLEDTYGYKEFTDLFDKAWFSFAIGLRKPSQEIFRYITRDAGLLPAETLFIDDSFPNVKAARDAGIHAWHLLPGEDITGLFTPEMIFLRPLRP
jgi:putative hydrolase of the HAD superfamily